MKNLWRRFADKYFNKRIGLHGQMFNAMMLVSIFATLCGSADGIISARGESLAGIPILFYTALCTALFWYANKYGKHILCGWIITIAANALFLPVAFHLCGGYHSGMTSWFILVIVFVAFIFNGKRAVVIALILAVEYTALCLYAYYHPDNIQHFGTREGQLTFIIASFLLAGFILTAIALVYFKIYDRQCQRLEAANREAEEARARALEYERMKSEFFANMSHELRTPLTVIASSAQMAMKQVGGDEQTLMDLKNINQEAMRLAGMVTFALKTLTTPFGSSDTGAPKEDFVFAPVNTGDLTGIVLGIVRPIAKQKGITLDIEIAEDSPQIMGDTDALIRLLLNLLHNAVNHSGAKNITVRAQKTEDSATLIIEDNGNGIPPELLPKIFDRGISGTGGTGLGLYICRQIVQAHGGNIIIENITPHGTIVKVTIPLHEGV